jgi:hypothetical protein
LGSYGGVVQNSFVTLWTLERCNWLQRVGDRGPLEVIFGGDHQSLPSLDSVAVGDVIYPVAVRDGSLWVIARMGIDELRAPEEYVRARLGFTCPATKMWDQLVPQIKIEHENFGHRFPVTCCHVAAVGRGTEFHFDRALPKEVLSQVVLGPKPGREQPIKGVQGGRLMSNFSLQGHVRRLSESSVRYFEGLC